MTKSEALEKARQLERETGKPHYVVWSVPEHTFLVMPTWPLLGEWYTSDGIRHG